MRSQVGVTGESGVDEGLEVLEEGVPLVFHLNEKRNVEGKKGNSLDLSSPSPFKLSKGEVHPLDMSFHTKIIAFPFPICVHFL